MKSVYMKSLRKSLQFYVLVFEFGLILGSLKIKGGGRVGLEYNRKRAKVWKHGVFFVEVWGSSTVFRRWLVRAASSNEDGDLEPRVPDVCKLTTMAEELFERWSGSLVWVKVWWSFRSCRRGGLRADCLCEYRWRCWGVGCCLNCCEEWMADVLREWGGTRLLNCWGSEGKSGSSIQIWEFVEAMFRCTGVDTRARSVLEKENMSFYLGARVLTFRKKWERSIRT